MRCTLPVCLLHSDGKQAYELMSNEDERRVYDSEDSKFDNRCVYLCVCVCMYVCVCVCVYMPVCARFLPHSSLPSPPPPSIPLDRPATDDEFFTEFRFFPLHYPSARSLHTRHLAPAPCCARSSHTPQQTRVRSQRVLELQAAGAKAG